MKTLKQIREASGGKEAYMKFFNSLLKKHGVSSPSELKGDKKKAFFNALDKGWESDDPNDKNETYTDPDNLDPDTTLNPDEDDLATGNKLGEKVKPPKQGDRDEYYRRVDKVNAKFKIGVGPGKRTMSDLKPAELKKYFAARDKALGHDIFDSVQEKAPPGMEDVVKKLKQDHSDEEAFAIAWSIHNKKESESELISEIFSRAQMKKAIGIARKSKGQYTKAYNAIEKIAKGLGDEHIIAAALKRANEAHEIGTDKYKKHCKKMVPGQNEAMKAESVKLTKWSVNEMTTEVEFDWDSYGFSKAKHNRLMRKHKVKVTPTTMKGPGGVDVDHFAKVVGNKENIRAWMKDWGYDDEYDARDYKDMGLGLRGEAVDEANRFSKKLNKPAKHIFDLALNAIRRNNVRGKKDQDAYVDDVAGVSLTDKEVALVKLAIQHESVNEGVEVDRRTVGFKAAMIRNEKSKKVREKSKLKKEKKKEQEVLDARYDYDGEVDTVLAAANKKIFGETAANSVSSGNVDMAPNAGKKKKKSLKVIKRDSY